VLRASTQNLIRNPHQQQQQQPHQQQQQQQQHQQPQLQPQPQQQGSLHDINKLHGRLNAPYRN
jgi:hypothetical protein